jgi:hypothetical protein
MNEIISQRPWWIRFVAEMQKTKAPTAISDALSRAVEKSLFDNRSDLHRQVFGYYRADAPDCASRNTAPCSFPASKGDEKWRPRK